MTTHHLLAWGLLCVVGLVALGMILANLWNTEGRERDEARSSIEGTGLFCDAPDTGSVRDEVGGVLPANDDTAYNDPGDTGRSAT